MITTALAAMAVSGLLAPCAANTLPTWQSDYAQAMATAVTQQKPMIVVIGHGDKGYASVMGNAQLPEKSSELLSASFVSIYLDTDTQAGKTLAAEFGMSEGVVISGKSGKQQALRHNGTVSAEALSGYLTRFSQPAESVVTTETRRRSAHHLHERLHASHRPDLRSLCYSVCPSAVRSSALRTDVFGRLCERQLRRNLSPLSVDGTVIALKCRSVIVLARFPRRRASLPIHPFDYGNRGLRFGSRWAIAEASLEHPSHCYHLSRRHIENSHSLAGCGSRNRKLRITFAIMG